MIELEDWLRLLKERTVYLNGMIDEDNAKLMIAQLLFLQMEDPKTPIVIEIGSPGGLLAPGFGILDFLQELKPPIHTRCRTEAHCLAALILASGTKGFRHAFASARFSFCPVYATPGNPIDSQEARRMQHLFHQKAMRVTGRSREEVIAACLGCANFDVPEAIRFGLIDGVLVA